MSPDQSPLLIHSGESLSFSLSIESTGKAMIVDFPNGETKKIEVRNGKSSIFSACPSECGSVIYCLLKSGKEQFYDTLTGEEISGEKLVGTKVRFYV